MIMTISPYFFTEVYTLVFLVSSVIQKSTLSMYGKGDRYVVGVASINLCCTIVMSKLVFSQLLFIT